MKNLLLLALFGLFSTVAAFGQTIENASFFVGGTWQTTGVSSTGEAYELNYQFFDGGVFSVRYRGMGSQSEWTGRWSYADGKLAKSANGKSETWAVQKVRDRQFTVNGTTQFHKKSGGFGGGISGGGGPKSHCTCCAGRGSNICMRCSGNGSVTAQEPDGRGGYNRVERDCDAMGCDGGRQECSCCDGSGKQ